LHVSAVCMTPEKFERGKGSGVRMSRSTGLPSRRQSSELDASTARVLWSHLQRLADEEAGPDLERELFGSVRRARWHDQHATRVLQLFVFPVAALSFAAFCAFIGQLWLAALMAAIFSLIQNMLSYYATGWAPHVASQVSRTRKVFFFLFINFVRIQVANVAQDTLNSTIREFYDLAEFLVEQFVGENSEQAVEVALRLRENLPSLVAAMEEHAHRHDLLHPLEDAVAFICARHLGEPSGSVSFHTVTMRHLTHSLLVEKELVELKRRLEVLEAQRDEEETL
jgi:hypothetical protein